MALKRKLSEVEEDYSDYDDSCSVSRSEDAGEGGEGGVTRKRRRGLIEKRRRDRINDSLLELKRLVPSAVEKSSSTKLEKAEILQMTVDYLKNVQGRNEYPDQRMAMDYQNVGFRDCVAEVSRYLVAVEGMDLQDPLRLRLMAHLHNYGSRGGAGATVPWHNGYPSHHYQIPAHIQDKSIESQTFINSEVSTYSRAGVTHSSPTYANSGYTNYSGFSSLPIPPPGGPYLHPPPHGKPYRPWGAEMAY
ncbi:hairy/enhancer-of-split related with YRPW motif protein 1 [Eurytemora carolleeae]|uniref:hairy/enhancer-of-split related with YRPW motif protein 1 n=1 Tax=Eurytemora carolleeae TaxID=1294199 RepID=UPI000C794AAB|nr:hairy/enhancer-of-split related with YRPW motif protein 1 [Eurytemora carolleeae]|eukprot:XP_023325074.1 hairy/enhancer-of-split related with YRPW motif protein 1-like [Eurytemora affinis]